MSTEVLDFTCQRIHSQLSFNELLFSLLTLLLYSSEPICASENYPSTQAQKETRQNHQVRVSSSTTESQFEFKVALKE